MGRRGSKGSLRRCSTSAASTDDSPSASASSLALGALELFRSSTQPPAAPKRPFDRRKQNQQDEDPRLVPQLSALWCAISRLKIGQPTGNPGGVCRCNIASARRRGDPPEPRLVELRLIEFTVRAANVEPALGSTQLRRAAARFCCEVIDAGRIGLNSADVAAVL